MHHSLLSFLIGPEVLAAMEILYQLPQKTLTDRRTENFVFWGTSWIFVFSPVLQTSIVSFYPLTIMVRLTSKNILYWKFDNFQFPNLSGLLWEVSSGKQRWLKQNSEVCKHHLTQSTCNVQEHNMGVMRMVIEILWESCYSRWDREGLRQRMRSNQGIGDPTPDSVALIYSCLLACL